MENSKICSKCNESKLLDNFHKNKTRNDGFEYNCKICENIRNKKRRENNPEREKERCEKYRKLNPEKIKKIQINYRKNNPEGVKQSRNKYINKYNKTNPHICAWRDVLKRILRQFGKKKEGNTIDLLGYSAIDLKNHITSLFTDGMSWDNHGEWHIDHIKTVISFDKETHPSIVNALSNLRPLWATTREINGIIYEGNLNR